MKVLNLTLKKKWFDMILSGQKKEEYREIKSYWEKRLNKIYDAILFRNGYGKNAPSVLIELKSITKGYGDPKLGAPYIYQNNALEGQTKKYIQSFILHLGDILETRND